MPGKQMIVVLSGASGSGKTSLAVRLKEMVSGIEKTISYTTRAPRADERDGVSYHFVDEGEFRARVKRKAFAEWAEVHGNLYGTSAEQIDGWFGAGLDVVCDIDVQGGEALRKLYGEQSVLVFILPPSWEVLEKRLRGRQTDSEETIARRLERAREEHAKAHVYDYLVVNDDFAAAAAAISDIVRAERLRTRRALSRLPDGLIGPPPRKGRASSRK